MPLKYVIVHMLYIFSLLWTIVHMFNAIVKLTRLAMLYTLSLVWTLVHMYVKHNKFA